MTAPSDANDKHDAEIDEKNCRYIMTQQEPDKGECGVRVADDPRASPASTR